jgi:hypothetical protein
MTEKISRSTRDELLNAIRQRYGMASRDAKGRILDEVVALMKCHRKHAIRLLRKSCLSSGGKTKGRERIYDQAVFVGLQPSVLTESGWKSGSTFNASS